jgi:hypothetical protein
MVHRLIRRMAGREVGASALAIAITLATSVPHVSTILP